MGAARVLNTEIYVERATHDPRYGAAANSKPPKRLDRTLVLFDCVTCDKCVPVCPNNANFTFPLPAVELPVEILRRTEDGWESEPAPALVIERKHQIGTFLDFCNECGNCDVFCPEEGGPYEIKPRFFGSEDDFHAFSTHEGFHLDEHRILGRVGDQVYRLSRAGDRFHYMGDDFELTLSAAGTVLEAEDVEPGTVVDLTWFHVLRWLWDAVGDTMNYASVRAEHPAGARVTEMWPER